MLANSLIVKKLPKLNHRPIGENSPNLVALVGAYARARTYAMVAPGSSAQRRRQLFP
jgi:hypothetical protein